MQEKWRLLITLDIPEIGVGILEKHCEIEVNKKDVALSKKQLIERVYDKHALCCGAEDVIDAEIMNAATHLKITARYGVGYDNVDVKAATERGILVTNTPGVLTEAVAEMTWCLLLGLARRIVEADTFTRSGLFKRSGSRALMGIDVKGKNLGIIGAGKIGTAVAKGFLGFGMNILYYDVIRNEELEKIGARKVELKYLLMNSDFVTLHVSLSNETLHLIGKEELTLMKETAYLINTSRGQVVDEYALVKALARKQIAGAGLDVYENEPHITKELLKMKNVLLAPHIGSTTKETWDTMAVTMANDCITALKGERPSHLVNPEVLE